MAVIDLSQTPPPDVIERLDYEAILAERKAALVGYYPAAEQPQVATALERESDPRTKLLEENAYRETVLRARINDAAQSVMLPYARGTDLDNLATLFRVTRLQTVVEDLAADPPVFAALETDADLRRRVQLSLEGLSVAGPEGAYIFQALSADGRVLDASAQSPNPGEVIVTVLSREGNGVADQGLLDTVLAAVSAEDVRPLTDYVTVQSAELVEYSVDATLYIYEGPDAQVIVDTARAAIEAYTAGQHRLGLDVTLSGIYAALHQPGVQRVALETPGQTYTISRQQAPYCTGITIDYGGVDE